MNYIELFQRYFRSDKKEGIIRPEGRKTKIINKSFNLSASTEKIPPAHLQISNFSNIRIKRAKEEENSYIQRSRESGLWKDGLWFKLRVEICVTETGEIKEGGMEGGRLVVGFCDWVGG